MMAAFTGTEGRFVKEPIYESWQQDAFKQMLQQGLAGLKDPQAGFQPIADQAMHQYKTQTVPYLAEQYGSDGGRSGAFEGALGSSASNLQRDLAAMQAQYGQQNQQNLMNMLNFGTTQQNQMGYEPRQASDISGMFQSILGGAGGKLTDEGLKWLFQKYLGGQQGQPVQGQPVQGQPVQGQPAQGQPAQKGSAIDTISNRLSALAPSVGTTIGTALGAAAPIPGGAWLGGTLGGAAGEVVNKIGKALYNKFISRGLPGN